jgi:hypothetical protein
LSHSRREAWRSFFSILQYSNTPSLQNLANKWTAGAPHKPNPVPVAGCPATGDDHSSLGGGCPTPLATYPGARAGSPPTLPYLVLHRVGFAELPRSPEELVRSYRTVSPLPRLRTRQTGSSGGAVYFLLHFPSRHRDSTLWSTLPCGVRTFLRTTSAVQRSSVLLRPSTLVFPVNYPLTVRTRFQAITALKLVIHLRRNVQMTPLTYGISHCGNSQSVRLE